MTTIHGHFEVQPHYIGSRSNVIKVYVDQKNLEYMMFHQDSLNFSLLTRAITRKSKLAEASVKS